MTAPKFKRLSYLLILFSLPVLTWAAYSISYQRLLENEIEAIQGQLSLFSSDLEAEIEKFSFLPRVLSRNQRLRQLLTAPATQVDGLAAKLNSDLLYINDVSRTDVIYLMRPDGVTIAASNWQAPDSFVGGNFEFRPYFKNAIAGREGRYFALGLKSQRRGYYFSSPVYAEDGQAVMGVIVVKVNIDKLEARWQDYPLTFLVTDRNGVVFSSNRPAWQFLTLKPLPAEALDEIRKNQQYPVDALKQALVTPSETYPGLLGITSSGNIPRQYLSAQQVITALRWDVHALTPASGTHRMALIYALVIAVFTVLSWGLFHLLSLRRYNLREKLELKQESERQLQEAHDKLEQRVEQRTRELRRNYQVLEREITERRQAEKELRRTQQELIHAAKLATLGQLASSITHELNQPLAAITNYAENARAFLERKNTAQTYANLDEILKLTERMNHITGQLRTFSHKTDDQFTQTSLNDCIHNALALIQPRLKSSATRVDLVLLDEAKVIANNIRLEQVFINLFSNAMDAMSKQEDRVIRVEQSMDEAWISTRVIDSGPGIDETQLPHIFDAFYTTKSVDVGLGLGLSISAEIIQNLGGELRASNHPAGGAQFEIVLKPAQ